MVPAMSLSAVDLSILVQNAGNVASNILGPGGTIDTFIQVRDAILEANLAKVKELHEEHGYGPVQEVVQAFPGAQVIPFPTQAPVQGFVPGGIPPVTAPGFAPQAPAQLAPQPQFQQAQAGPAPAPVPGVVDEAAQAEAHWRELFGNVSGWYDNRADKANPNSRATEKSPDFKRKGKPAADQPALWINNKNTPAWVHQALGTGGAA
jgi:hypothetical protein